MRFYALIAVVLISTAGLCHSADPRTHLSKIRGLIVDVDSRIDAVAKKDLENELYWVLKEAIPELTVYTSADKPNLFQNSDEVCYFRIALIRTDPLKVDFASFPDDYVASYFYSVRVGAFYQDSFIGVFFKDYWNVIGSGTFKQRELRDAVTRQMAEAAKAFVADWNKDRNNR